VTSPKTKQLSPPSAGTAAAATPPTPSSDVFENNSHLGFLLPQPIQPSAARCSRCDHQPQQPDHLPHFEFSSTSFKIKFSNRRICDSFCLLLQSAPQVVVAVARTIQFYSVQSDVQLNAHTHQQVVAAAGL
jgi:hypothetical protein